MAFSKNYVCIASNIFGPNGGFGAILRLPITSLNAGAAFNYNYYYDTTRFTFKPVQGATNVKYSGSNWGGGVNGSGLPVYRWAPKPGNTFFKQRSVTSV